MTESQLKFVKPILDTFENDDIKKFAVEILKNIPNYIWEVGASSTAKYHPAYTIGTLGLMKHQVAVARMMNFFLELEQYKNRFDTRQRDLLRLAALTHDGMKSGTQEDYEKSKYTKFDHPLLMAKVYMSYKDKGIIPNEELKYIASAIGKHMGQWNTDKKSTITLPKPNDEASELLHLADYIVSRKCLAMSFDEYEIPKEELPNIEEYKLSFGKHSGKTLLEVKESDPGWISWAKDNLDREPIKSLLQQM